MSLSYFRKSSENTQSLFSLMQGLSALPGGRDFKPGPGRRSAPGSSRGGPVSTRWRNEHRGEDTVWHQYFIVGMKKIWQKKNKNKNKLDPQVYVYWRHRFFLCRWPLTVSTWWRVCSPDGAAVTFNCKYDNTVHKTGQKQSWEYDERRGDRAVNRRALNYEWPQLEDKGWEKALQGLFRPASHKSSGIKTHSSSHEAFPSRFKVLLFVILQQTREAALSSGGTTADTSVSFATGQQG